MQSGSHRINEEASSIMSSEGKKRWKGKIHIKRHFRDLFADGLKTIGLLTAF